MSAEDLEKYETEMELQLYREYRDVVGLFSHVVETERRFYLTNQVELNVHTSDNGEVFFEATMQDAWGWDMYRPARRATGAPGGRRAGAGSASVGAGGGESDGQGSPGQSRGAAGRGMPAAGRVLDTRPQRAVRGDRRAGRRRASSGLDRKWGEGLCG